jgi:hypothetical protein
LEIPPKVRRPDFVLWGDVVIWLAISVYSQTETKAKTNVRTTNMAKAAVSDFIVGSPRLFP